MKKLFAEIAGWYGVIAILLAYALVSFSALSSESIIFQILNLSGAIGLVVINLEKKVNQSIAINSIWAIIALLALVRIIL